MQSVQLLKLLPILYILTVCNEYEHCVEFERREKRKAFIMIMKDYIQGECMQGYIETCRGTTEGKQIN